MWPCSQSRLGAGLPGPVVSIAPDNCAFGSSWPPGSCNPISVEQRKLETYLPDGVIVDLVSSAQHHVDGALLVAIQHVPPQGLQAVHTP
jgi:hypothetical protein